MARNVPIMRTLEPEQIARLRKEGEFSWTDVALEGGPEPERVREAFGLSQEALRTLCNFDLGGSPVSRFHVEEDLVVFAFWCSATPEPPPLGGAESLGLFRANVCLHGDYLLTVHERPFDLSAVVAPEGIPHRTERYTVYVVLEGMTATMLEALNSVEREIAGIETDLIDSGTRGPGPRRAGGHPQPAVAAHHAAHADRRRARAVRPDRARRSSASRGCRPTARSTSTASRASSTAPSTASTPPRRRFGTCSTCSSTRPPTGSPSSPRSSSRSPSSPASSG